MTKQLTGWDIFEVDPFDDFDDDPDPAPVAAVADPAAVVCDHCGQAIVGEVHPDHERWCNKPDTGCQCVINACAGCCEWCQREDFPTAAEWLVDKLTMEHPRAGLAIINACWVLRTIRSGSLPGLRKVWTEIVTRADILEEVEAAVADAGGSLDILDWKELRGHWYEAARLLHEAGDLDLTMASAPEVHVVIEDMSAVAEPTPWPETWQRTGEEAMGVEVFTFA